MRLRSVWLRLLSVLVAGISVSGAASAEEAARAYTLGDARIDVRLEPAARRFLVGQPVWLDFAVENLGESPLTLRTSLLVTAGGRATAFDLAVRRVGSDTPLPRPDTGPVVGGFMSSEEIAAGETWRKGLFLPFWAEIDRPGRYVITCRRTLVSPRPAADPSLPDQHVATETQVEVEVVPQDPATMGRVIDALGRAVLDGTDETRQFRALRSLHAVRDARAIGWWKKALASGSSKLMYEAPRGLGVYDDVAAVEALFVAARTQASDVLDARDAEHAVKAASAIRWSAANWLALSPHPLAVEGLVRLHEDASARVRKAVARGLGRRLDEKHLPVLRKLADDADPQVRDEARQALRQR